MRKWIGAALAVTCCPMSWGSVRLKEIVSVEGVRENQLIGYGLVVGLNGTGDRAQTLFSVQSLTNLLQQMGVAVSPQLVRVKNVAAVMVTAKLPAFAQPGAQADVAVAAMGDASNLQGGMLVMTSLKCVDGSVNAIAQGPIVTGGFVAGSGGNSQTLNFPTVGRVPNGAMIERSPPSVVFTDKIRLQLRQADFTTSSRVAHALNQRFAPQGPPIARAENPALVGVTIPADYSGRPTEFVAEMEKLTVDADRQSRVIVNERTGTIVLGKDVKISPVAIMHGNLTVEIQTSYAVTQPPPLSSAQAQVTPEVKTNAAEEKTHNLVLQGGATVEELVRGLTSIGSTARDIISILQSLKVAGALEADLEVI